MITKRNISLALGALCLAGGLAACGSTSSPSTSKSAISKGKVTITFWNEMTGPYEKALDGEIKAFETTDPNVTVSDVVVPNDAALEPKLLAGIVGHTLPTLSQMDPQWTEQFLQTKSLVDMTPLIRHSANFGLNEFYPTLLSSGEFNGGQYLLPFDINDSELFYNEAAFKKAGINGPPSTWSEFVSDAAKLSGGNDHAFAITLVHSYPWRAFFYEAGGRIATSSGAPNKSGLSSTGAANAALALWGNMVKDGSAILTQGYASQTDFANETSTMLIGGSAFYPYLVPAVAGKFKIGIAPMPADKVAATSIDGGYLGIFSQASASQQAAAFQFVKYLTSEKGQLYWMEHSEGYLAARKDAAKAGAAFLASHPAQQIGLNQLKVAVPMPNYPWYNTFDTNSLIPAIESVAIGKESAATAAKGLYGAAVAAANAG